VQNKEGGYVLHMGAQGNHAEMLQKMGVWNDEVQQSTNEFQEIVIIQRQALKRGVETSRRNRQFKAIRDVM